MKGTSLIRAVSNTEGMGKQKLMSCISSWEAWIDMVSCCNDNAMLSRTNHDG